MIWHQHTLARLNVLPSAQIGLTSLFGMGRGGHYCNRHHNMLYEFDILLKENK